MTWPVNQPYLKTPKSIEKSEVVIWDSRPFGSNRFNYTGCLDFGWKEKLIWNRNLLATSNEMLSDCRAWKNKKITYTFIWPNLQIEGVIRSMKFLSNDLQSNLNFNIFVYPCISKSSHMSTSEISFVFLKSTTWQNISSDWLKNFSKMNHQKSTISNFWSILALSILNEDFSCPQRILSPSVFLPIEAGTPCILHIIPKYRKNWQFHRNSIQISDIRNSSYIASYHTTRASFITQSTTTHICGSPIDQRYCNAINSSVWMFAYPFSSVNDDSATQITSVNECLLTSMLRTVPP